MTLAKVIEHGKPVYKTLKLTEVKDVSTDGVMRLAFTVSNEVIDRNQRRQIARLHTIITQKTAGEKKA